jgi:hypothetical protein
MNKALRAIINHMLNNRIIGEKHIPEKRIIKSRTKWLNKEERKEFKTEYEALIKNNIIFRTKKRTGKDYDWHISLNPRKLQEIED